MILVPKGAPASEKKNIRRSFFLPSPFQTWKLLILAIVPAHFSSIFYVIVFAVRGLEFNTNVIWNNSKSLRSL